MEGRELKQLYELFLEDPSKGYLWNIIENHLPKPNETEEAHALHSVRGLNGAEVKLMMMRILPHPLSAINDSCPETSSFVKACVLYNRRTEVGELLSHVAMGRVLAEKGC